MTVRACQTDPEMRHKKGGVSPLKFEYGKQMPLLEILRNEVRTLKEQLRELHTAQGARARELRDEEHGKWKQGVPSSYYLGY